MERIRRERWQRGKNKKREVAKGKEYEKRGGKVEIIRKERWQSRKNKKEWCQSRKNKKERLQKGNNKKREVA